MKELCEKYDASTFQQLYKVITGENNELTTKNVYPITLIQSVFDGLTGTRLDQILAPVIDIVDNLDSDEVSRPLAARQGKVLKEMIEAVKTIDMQIVEELPATGQSNIIYLVPDNKSSGDDTTYIEYVWVSAEQKYVTIGSIGSIKVDGALSESSENPVQNKVITKALKKINAELFPLSISVSGAGIYEKGTAQNITVKWIVKEGSSVVTPDTVSVNGTVVSPSVTSKVFEGVTENTTYIIKTTKDGVTVQGSTSAVFVNPSYFGAVDAGFTPTEDAVKALTKNVKNTKNYTGNISLTHQKVCYAYPKSMGALTAVKDANNFEYLQSYTRSEVTVGDETYYVYILTDPVTIGTFRQIYS